MALPGRRRRRRGKRGKDGGKRGRAGPITELLAEQVVLKPEQHIAAHFPALGYQILGFERRPLVSSDFTNDPRSSIVDGLSTMVVNGTQVKVYAWYDIEWGYACRLADIARMVAARL